MSWDYEHFGKAENDKLVIYSEKHAHICPFCINQISPTPTEIHFIISISPFTSAQFFRTPTLYLPAAAGMIGNKHPLIEVL